MEQIEKTLTTLPGWLSETETQVLLGCKGTKLWYLRKKKLLRYSKIGNKVFYKLDEILKTLEKNQENN